MRAAEQSRDGGRRAPAPQAGGAPHGPLLVAGIDIGGTAVKIGLLVAAGEEAEIVAPGAAGERRPAAEATIETPLAADPAQFVRAVAGALRSLAGDRRLAAVGVGCAGLVSSGSGIVHRSPNLPRWREAPLGELMRAALGAPVAVLNDANAFALAEARLGAARGSSPVVALTLGTGVGGAIVEDGLLRGGRHGFGGEAGHMSVDLEGPVCPCGQRGCLELFVGRRGLVRAYRRRARWAAGEAGFDLAAGDETRLTPKLMAEAAGRGDRAAAEAFRRAGEILGGALASLSNLIDPQAFVIGGGIAQAGDLLFAPARETLAERAMIGRERVAPILEAALGYRAGMLGAALAALDALGIREPATGEAGS
ncbi:MAG: ROK family protein [Candidatus Eisenbacteria bacterium]|uniref:ROK family protein n=1 Tax=Eiseniibacteriota bacterium TaxID=2212470 RepID=A0A937X850_UNCEI|nr:ROK family protein [Candidatus Eisenbacteria bacterium]